MKTLTKVERVKLLKKASAARNRLRRKELKAFSTEHKMVETIEQTHSKLFGKVFIIQSAISIKDTNYHFQTSAKTINECQADRNKWLREIMNIAHSIPATKIVDMEREVN